MSAFSAAMVSAMSRVAIRPEAQAGAPGQAAMRVRGSAASVTKPRVAAVCWRGWHGGRRLAEEEQGAARGEADFGGAEGEGALREVDDLVCRHAAEGQGDAEGGGGCGSRGKDR